MAYKIPSDEEVLTAVQRVILKHHTITSQKRIKEFVEKELRTLDKDFRVSGSRIRKLVLKSKYFHLEMDYKVPPGEVGKDKSKVRSSNKSRSKKPKKKGKAVKAGSGARLRSCPVCASKVKKIENKTLQGGYITTGFKCTACPYHTNLPVKLPARYTFSIRRL